MHTTHRGRSGGFSFVELMTVIAIIGILSTITIVGLQNARNAAKDKSAAASMQGILVEATFYKSKNNGSYSGVCSATEVAKLITAAQNATSKTVTCQVSGDSSAFGATVQLHSNKYYCVDSKRFAGERNTAGLTGARLCPAS